MILFVNKNSGILFLGGGVSLRNFYETFEFYSTVTRVFRLYTIIAAILLTTTIQ